MKTKNYTEKISGMISVSRFFRVLIISAVFLTAYIYAQPAEEWMKTYSNPNGTGTDYCDRSVIDAQGNIYISAATRTANTNDDVMLLKYNSSGTFLWSKTYNYSFNGTEQPNDIAVDNNGNIYITGTSTRSQGSFDCLLLKFDPNGNIIWVKRINKSNYSDRQAEGVSLVLRDGIYIGVNFDYNGFSECGITKYNFNGDSLSYLTLGTMPNFTYGMWKMVQDISTLSIYAICSGDMLPNEEEDFLVKKISINGSLTQVWSKIYTGSNHQDDRARNIAVAPDGNIIVTGYTEVNNQGKNMLLLKMGRDDGSILFQKTYNNAVNNQDDYGENIAFDNNANIIINGSTNSLSAPTNILILKYTPAGTLTWTKIYDHTGNRHDWVRDLKTDNAGNIYFIAECFDGPQQTTSILTAKFSASGELDWFIEKTGQNTNQGVNTLHILNNGSLIISGNTEIAGIRKTMLSKYGSTIGIETVSNEIPSQFLLSQNYPNPFNPVTNINFSIPISSEVKLLVFDVTGKQVAELINTQLTAGSYKYDFNASYLTSGVYFYKLVTENYTETKKMILVK